MYTSTNTDMSAIKSGGDLTMKYGVILPEKHPTDPNLYRVYVGDATASASSRVESGVWCHNALFPYTRNRQMQNNPISYGAYMPLYPETPVLFIAPASGLGVGSIIALAPTNTNVPDPENEKLHMIAQTPGGSWIAIDDTTENIQIMFKGGTTSVVLAEDAITLEISKGDKSGKKHGTSLSISENSFSFKTRDSELKFDESGFSIGFDAIDGQEKASNFLVSRDTIKMAAGKNVQINAADSFTVKANKTQITGETDNSITGGHVIVNGSQLTTINGTQISIHGQWSVNINSTYIGLKASMKIMEKTPIKEIQSTLHIQSSVQTMLFSSTAASIITPIFSLLAPLNLQDLEPVSSGAAAAAAAVVYEATEGAAAAAEMAAVSMGEMLLMKNEMTAVTTYATGTGPMMPGAGKRADNEETFFFNAKDKNSKKSLNSGIATKYILKNQVMEGLSVVSPLIQTSQTALYTGGTQTRTENNNLSILQSSLAGFNEARASSTSTSMTSGQEVPTDSTSGAPTFGGIEVYSGSSGCPGAAGMPGSHESSGMSTTSTTSVASVASVVSMVPGTRSKKSASPAFTKPKTNLKNYKHLNPTG